MAQSLRALLIEEGLVPRTRISSSYRPQFQFLGLEEGVDPQGPDDIVALISSPVGGLGTYRAPVGSLQGHFKPSKRAPYLKGDTFTFLGGASPEKAERVWQAHFQSLLKVLEGVLESSEGVSDPNAWAWKDPKVKTYSPRFFLTPFGDYLYHPHDPVAYPNRGSLYFTPKKGPEVTLEDHSLSFVKAVKLAAKHYAGLLSKGGASRQASHGKVSHRPILAVPSALKSGLAFMTYKIDAAANNSKFYEGMISEQPDGTWLYQRRWGALTDDGPDRRRVDGAKLDKYGLEFSAAKKLLDAEYGKRLKDRGYSDAMKTRPVGQYPVGLSRTVGFGWGSQGIAKSVAELRRLSGLVSEARLDVTQDNAPALLADLRQIQGILQDMPNSSMAAEIRKLLRPPVARLEMNPRFIADPAKTQKELMTLKRYVDRQLKETNV